MIELYKSSVKIKTMEIELHRPTFHSNLINWIKANFLPFVPLSGAAFCVIITC